MAALCKAGSPVPSVFGRCMDRAVIGTEFYVMEVVGGVSFPRQRLIASRPWIARPILAQ